MDMLDLQRHVLCSAVDTLSAPLFKQILFDLIAVECALLIFNPTDLRMFHFLQVELDQFLADGHNGTHVPESIDPGEHVDHATLERGSQPPLLFVAPVLKTGFSVAGCALSSASSHGSSFLQIFGYLLPSMSEFSGKDHVPRCIIDNGQPGRFAARINLDAQGGTRGLLNGLVENDGKWKPFKDSRLAR